MKEEIVRVMDELGRVVIPAEYRSALGWAPSDVYQRQSLSRAGMISAEPFSIRRLHSVMRRMGEGGRGRRISGRAAGKSVER